MDNETKELLAEVSQGNPGCITAIMQAHNAGKPILPLLTTMSLTETRAPCIWLVFKDVCGGNVQKFWSELESWFSNSHDSLGSFMAEKHPEHAQAFTYYT